MADNSRRSVRRCCPAAARRAAGVGDTTAKLVAGRLAKDPGYRATPRIPGIGPILAAVFVAEIGDVRRLTSARHGSAARWSTRFTCSATPGEARI
jgi:transposase